MEIDCRSSLGENKSLFGWKHPMTQILKWKSLNKKKIEEDGDRIKEDRAFCNTPKYTLIVFGHVRV